MKKRTISIFFVFFVHLLVILSMAIYEDITEEGFSLGWSLYFLLLYIVSLPPVTGIVAIADTVVGFFPKTKCPVGWNIACGILGILNLICAYGVRSVLGEMKIYAVFVYAGVTWLFWIVRAIIFHRKKSKP